MAERSRIGLLPLYLAFYDEHLPALRGELEPLVNSVVAAFRREGVDVVRAPVCCVREEIVPEVVRFDEEDADLVVTLHLAYSPSLEAVDALEGVPLPVLLLDTTPDRSFGRDVDPARLLYNHGIHGVQDLAAMLRRRGKDYRVVAGHLDDPATIRRAAEIARAAHAAHSLRHTRAVRIGPAFAGMGDFHVEDHVLRRVLGIQAHEVAVESLASYVRHITEEDVTAEVERDAAAYEVDCPAPVHRRSVRLGLGLRRFLAEGQYSAFSMNFQAFDFEKGPLSTVPFLECCKAMARGIGYAGEGDVLTASLIGALERAFGVTTFTEMFCPDWQGGALFLSHMGEVNPEVAADRPRLYVKDYPFGRAQNPATLACAPRPGAATLANLAPGPADTFRLIFTPVTVQEDGTHPASRDWVRAWARPEMALEPFLERYSQLGGTHHCALMLGDHREALAAFARFVGIEGCLIGG